jgi:hypothetical protein
MQESHIIHYDLTRAEYYSLSLALIFQQGSPPESRGKPG